MNSSPETVSPCALSQALAANEQLQSLVKSLSERLEEVTRQLNWFKQQMFGTKSEKLHSLPDSQQLSLGEIFVPNPSLLPLADTEVKGHQRKRAAPVADEGITPFFDESRVPIETIVLPCPLTAGLSPEQIDQDFERIGSKHTYRLAQRPGSFVVIDYERPQFKARDTGAIACAAAPLGVFEGSRADVSFVAGMMIDKIAYHLPLYRQHQRLTDAGFKVSRQWLTQLMQQAAALIEPIYEAQLDSVRLSRIKAMDETPIRAGLAGPGKMKTGYFWPVYGEFDEVCFAFHPSHHQDHVATTLGLIQPVDAVLLSDGNTAYAKYAAKVGIKHARCWVHVRRYYFRAKEAEPEAAETAMRMIGGLYKVEEQIRERKLSGEPKRMYRAEHSKPLVDAFFAWVAERFVVQGLQPSSPLTKALAYTRAAQPALEVFLTDADVPLDTNHLERALRVIPLGKKNWLFSWTEVGAKHIGMLNSLIVTCRLHDINPYDYLVDVLQRISEHPNHLVSQLTPRLWKQHFADNPMRSDLYQLGKH